jgi:hypothetical protein
MRRSEERSSETGPIVTHLSAPYRPERRPRVYRAKTSQLGHDPNSQIARGTSRAAHESICRGMAQIPSITGEIKRFETVSTLILIASRLIHPLS